MNAFMDIVPGAHVDYAGEQYVITHILTVESVLAKHIESGRTQSLSITELGVSRPQPREQLEQYETADSISDERWQAAEKSYELIKPVLEVEKRTRKRVEEVAEGAGVHPSTVYRKLAVFLQTGRISSLAAQEPDGGRGKSRLSNERETLLQAIIKTKYLTNQKLSVAKVFDSVKLAFRAGKLDPPHINTVHNRIKQIDQRTKDEARLGPEVAAKRHSAYPGRFRGADFPLAVGQIDHTPMDVILVDDVDRQPIGRAWLTLLIDVFSRMVLGYHISFDRPSAMSVALCLVNALLPKDALLAKFGIKASWPCWGTLSKIHADNAREFRGNTLKKSCKDYNMDLEWRPVKQPRYGAHIERMLGTVLKTVHSLPGTTFSNVQQRGKYDSEGKAVLTESELEHWFLLYITGVYHQKKHKGIGIPPLKQYEMGILGTAEIAGRGFPRKIVDEDRLLLDLMPYFLRTIQEYGVSIDTVHYFADVLRRYVGMRDPKNPSRALPFIFKRQHHEISPIYFYDPEVKQYFRIPYRDTSRPPMTVWELRAAKLRLKEQGVAKVNEQMIFDSYSEMQAIEERATHETKKTRRARQSKQDHQRASKPKTADDTQSPFTSNKAAAIDDSVVIPHFEELDIVT
jgi:putative transposase